MTNVISVPLVSERTEPGSGIEVASMSAEHGPTARLDFVCLVFEDEAGFRPKQRERQGRLSNRPDDLTTGAWDGDALAER
jgi:hypothetical protein